MCVRDSDSQSAVPINPEDPSTRQDFKDMDIWACWRPVKRSGKEDVAQEHREPLRRVGIIADQV